jgi:lysophospholipase L1-like esterase
LATTTPTADADVGAPHEYNGVIKNIALRYGLEVNDLFEAVAADIRRYICPDRIHLTPEGTDLAASRVAACISKYLK